MIKVCVSGATGWTGGAVAEAVVAAEDMDLVSAVARRSAGGEVLGAPCFASVAEALDGPAFDVLIDYTALSVVEANTQAAIAAQASTTRETVARVVSQLTHSGLAERKGRTLYVRDPSKLRQMSERLGEHSA